MIVAIVMKLYGDRHRELASLARRLVCGGRGILAIDESVKTCNARFAALGIAPVVEQRRAYRELLITAPEIERYVSGMILYDETIGQSTNDGMRFVDALSRRNIVPGIKVDTGTTRLPMSDDETITEGLDGLRHRLTQYRALGARFAKWRAVFRIAPALPSEHAIRTNAHALGRYAALCQENGMVPIIEPEVLADGDHSVARCAEVTRRTLHAVFAELREHGVPLDAIILKPNMVLAGSSAADRPSLDEIVRVNLEVLHDCVPPAVPGIAFLSGGQDDRDASERLAAMNASVWGERPWSLTFSYGRAIQQAALAYWSGDPERVDVAQRILLHRAYCNAMAARGAYDRRKDGAPVAQIA